MSIPFTLRSVVLGTLRARAARRCLLLALAMLPAACRRDAPRTGPDAAAKGAAAQAATPASHTGAAARQHRDRGRKLYLAECSGCHGERGRGDGPAAEAVASKPRDFVAEPFKYRTTSSGSPPRRAD